MGVTQPAPATPAATPLREANQQRVDAAAQRVRQAMDYRKYLPGDPFRKDVELLIETLREALDGWIEAHQRLDHSGITDCTRCNRIAEIRSGLKLATLSPQTDSQETRT